ncbi:MAG: hypothetical protein F6K55_09260 [Moorea sp. SIO4A3]|nr:hypothetical protein [Moorena sp. SIO4A3]
MFTTPHSDNNKMHLDRFVRIILIYYGLRVSRMPTLINRLISHGHRVHVLYIKGHWLDIDQVEDLFKAGSF